VNCHKAVISANYADAQTLCGDSTIMLLFDNSGFH